VQIGAIRYDKHSGALYRNGEVMELTPRELALMHALLVQPGHAVTKERLYELVFPGQLDGDVVITSSKRRRWGHDLVISRVRPRR